MPLCLPFPSPTHRHAMKTKSFLELADIKAIAAASEAEGAREQLGQSAPSPSSTTAATCCGCSAWTAPPPISAHIAPGKANTAAVGRREGKVYEDMINGGRVSFLSAPDMKGLLEGGVPIVKDGNVVGAVGVSGVKSNEDAQIARAGIAAIGLA